MNTGSDWRALGLSLEAPVFLTLIPLCLGA